MLVKIRFLKDHSGYKKGQECAMLLSYAERFQREGDVLIVDGDVDKWIVKPEPEVEKIEDEQIAEQYGVDELINLEEEEKTSFLDRLLNNKK